MRAKIPKIISLINDLYQSSIIDADTKNKFCRLLSEAIRKNDTTIFINGVVYQKKISLSTADYFDELIAIAQ